MIPQIPEWILKTGIALAVVGAVTVAGGLIAGLFWLVNHLRFA